MLFSSWQFPLCLFQLSVPIQKLPFAGSSGGWGGSGRVGARWTPFKSSCLARRRPWMMTLCNVPSASRLASIASRWVKKTILDDAKPVIKHPAERAADFEHTRWSQGPAKVAKRKIPIPGANAALEPAGGPSIPRNRAFVGEFFILVSMACQCVPGMPDPRPSTLDPRRGSLCHA